MTLPGAGTITPAAQFGGIFTTTIFANDFFALIELLETQGNVQTQTARAFNANEMEGILSKMS